MNMRQTSVSARERTIRRHGLRSGFTLIELLVVVGAVAVFSAILLPVFLTAADAARKHAARLPTAESESSRPEAAPSPPPPSPPAGPLPVLNSVALQMALTSSYHRIGMDVFTRFQVDCTGQIAFQRPDGAGEDRVALLIPFPANTLEARDVELSIRRPGSAGPIMPNNVTYTRNGISCTCPIHSGETFMANVRFTALGRDQFDYALPPARQLRSVAIVLGLAGTDAFTIPDDSLQPSASDRDHIQWKYDSLVSDRQITVLIPAAESPLARVLLLLRLIALGVLLFGAGFWYLSEQAEPGRLDRFRLGHFLLLALTYSLFFVIFAVLGFHGTLSTPVSMLVSAAFSLPLLIFHVSRVLDFRFALTRVAPMALFTVGLVVNGVYGGEVRDYVFLGAVIVTLAYVTLSYPAWAAGRERYRAKVEAAHAARCQALIAEVTTVLHAPIAELSAEEARAAEYLKSTPTEDPATRARIERAREPVKDLLEGYEALTKSLAHLPTTPGWESAGFFTDLDQRIDAFRNRLAPGLANLQSALAPLPASPTLPEGPSAPPVIGEIHCLACGQAVPDAPFCQKCGTPHPSILTCSACAERIVIPIHMLATDRPAGRLFCLRCGAPASSL